MTSFPFRVGPSDLLFYGQGSSTLRLHATYFEPLMLISQVVLRQANNDYNLEKNPFVTPVRIEPSATVMNPGDKKAVTVTFSSTHISSFAIGKILIKAIRLHSEEVLGTYQIPIFCVAPTIIFQCEKFIQTVTNEQKLTIHNSGAAPGFLYFSRRELAELHILSPGERILLINPSDITYLLMGPLLLRSISALFDETAITTLNLRHEVIVGVKSTLPISSSAESDKTLRETARLACAIQSAYTSYPFRSNLLHFLFNQCTFYNYTTNLLEKTSIFLKCASSTTHTAAETSNSSSINSSDPQLLSSSDLSVVPQPLLSSSRPVGGLSDKMLSSSTSPQAPKSLPLNLTIPGPPLTNNSEQGVPLSSLHNDSSLSRLPSAKYTSISQMHPSASSTQTVQRMSSCDQSNGSSHIPPKSVTFNTSNGTSSDHGRALLASDYSLPPPSIDSQSSLYTSNNATVEDTLPSGYDMHYKDPQTATSEREKELIDRYNSALSDYRSLSQISKDNSRSASRLLSDLQENRTGTPYATEQEMHDEYLPDMRSIYIRFAEDSIIYNNPAMKWSVDGIPIYDSPNYNATTFWRVLTNSFLLCGSPLFPPYLESIRGTKSVGGICYLTGTVTIENNANQSGFFSSLLNTKKLEHTDVLDAAEELHYLYYSLSFVTFDPSVLRMHLSIKANRPLFGYLAPGERHTIAITIGIAYSDVEGVDLPELPLFFQALRRASNAMHTKDSGTPLFLRVFAARFDRKFFQDELESLAVLQETIRTPSRFCIRECIDLPVQFLTGTISDRTIGASLMPSHVRLLEHLNSEKGSAAAKNEYSYLDINYESERNNVQCLNLPFLRLLASLPVVKVLDGQSITLPEVLLKLPEADVRAHEERKNAKALLKTKLSNSRNSLASRSGTDVLFISDKNPSTLQRRRATSASALQLSKNENSEDAASIGNVISTVGMIPVIVPVQTLNKATHAGVQFGISVTPASTPIIKEYVREATNQLGSSNSLFNPTPILTSIFGCAITTSYHSNEPSIPERYLCSNEIIVSSNDLSQYSNVTASVQDPVKYSIATIKFYANFTRKITKRLIQSLASCDSMPCFIEQKFEVHLRSFARQEIGAVSYTILVRVPLQVDQSSLIFLRSKAPVSHADRLMRNSVSQYTAQSPNHSNLLISNCAMNVKMNNVNGFLDELWSDSHALTLPPASVGAKSFSSITLHNAADYPIVAILYGLSLPFSYRTTCKLQPLSSLLVPIDFAPKKPGTYTGMLIISYNRIISNEKQEELLLQKSLYNRQIGARHAFSKEHYLELEEVEHLTQSEYVQMARPKSAQMWDNMRAKPESKRGKARAISSKTISREGLSHMEELELKVSGPVSKAKRSQIVPWNTMPRFYVHLTGIASNTPLLVTQPQSQLSHMSKPTLLESGLSIIYLQRGSRSARILLTNISDRSLFYDTQLLFPSELESHDEAYHLLTVLPPSGYIEPKCQVSVTLYGEQRFNSASSIVLNIYTRYKSDGDTMKALSYRGIVKTEW